MLVSLVSLLAQDQSNVALIRPMDKSMLSQRHTANAAGWTPATDVDLMLAGCHLFTYVAPYACHGCFSKNYDPFMFVGHCAHVSLPKCEEYLYQSLYYQHFHCIHHPAPSKRRVSFATSRDCILPNYWMLDHHYKQH